VTLVLLRLAVGWHFFMQGVEKYTDPNFSSAGFLLQAKGPLAEFYHNKVPQVHGWRSLLAAPPASELSDEARAEEIRQWQIAYDERRAQAREAGQREVFEVQPHQPYSAWAAQIIEDWRAALDRFLQLPDVTEVDADRAAAALAARQTELIEYLEQIEPEIADFHRELERVRALTKRDEAGEVPYYGERILSLENEALRTPQPWLAEVTAIENAYFDDLRDIYADAQEQAALSKAEPQSRNGSSESPAEATQAQAGRGDQAESSPPAGNGATGASAQEGTDQREGLPPEPPADADAPSAAAPVADAPAASTAADSTAAGAPEEANAAGAASEPAPNSDPAAATSASEDTPSAEGEEEPMTLAKVFIDDKAAQLALVDKVVTWLTLGVGALLIVGLFVPLAGFAGAIFLAAVISTQPPWVSGAQETYYQFIEMFSLLVLACTCAGRWLGLDYFFTLLFARGGRSQS
jgi:uncharacterized membrane protein YphA (DoxX/SURF4 family)